MIFFFQAEDGIRDAQESRGLGDVYKETDMTRITIKGEIDDELPRLTMSIGYFNFHSLT